MRAAAMHFVAVLALVVWSSAAPAHNNPNYREVLLATVEVSVEADAAGRFSAPFAIAEWPPRTIEYVWRVEGAEGVRFAVVQAGELVAPGLADGATSTRLKGEDLAIVQVEGASGPFVLQVFANVLDRSSPTG
jgi:hypothetical protein